MDTIGPDTFWLTATNVGLGLVTLACLLVIGIGVWREFAARAAARVARGDDHAFVVEGLGLTMADGGEPVAKTTDEKK